MKSIITLFITYVSFGMFYKIYTANDNNLYNRILQKDKNGDKIITKEELGRASHLLKRFDKNNDQKFDETELKNISKDSNQMGGRDPSTNQNGSGKHDKGVVNLGPLVPSGIDDMGEVNLNDGLELYLNFDQQTQDKSQNNTVVKNFGGKFIEGIKGQAYHLDGEDDYIEISPKNVKSLKEGTISFWIKTDSDPSNGIKPLFMLGGGQPESSDRNENLILEIGHFNKNDKNIFFTFSDRKFNDNRSKPEYCISTRKKQFPSKQWTHIAVVSGEEKEQNGFFINGERVQHGYNFGSGAKFLNDTKNKDTIWLGKGYYSKSRTIYHLDGAIDEFRIYNRPLKMSEIITLAKKH